MEAASSQGKQPQVYFDAGGRDAFGLCRSCLTEQRQKLLQIIN